jgi:hypothetical protein
MYERPYRETAENSDIKIPSVKPVHEVTRYAICSILAGVATQTFCKAEANIRLPLGEHLCCVELRTILTGISWFLQNLGKFWVVTLIRVEATPLDPSVFACPKRRLDVAFDMQ